MYLRASRLGLFAHRVVWFSVQIRTSPPSNETALHAAQACKDLTLAAASGKTADVVRSIDLGAEVNATVNSYTPLMRAANWGHLGTLAALIEEGADLFATDRQNRTALDWSRIARHDKAARMLERAMENDILHRRYLLYVPQAELLCDS